MVKYLFVIVNSLVFLLAGVINDDNGVRITGTIPDKMVAGQEVEIILKVQKGRMSGFAKLQLDLPEGIVVTAAEEKGSNYSFNDGMAKWVWAVLPQAEEIEIRLTLLAEENASGLKTINAKYSYVENNVKQVVEMTPVETMVIAPGSGSPAVATHNIAEVPTAPTQTLENNESQIEPSGVITATRTIEPGNSINEFLISVRIFKGNTRGFARYSDDLPAGVTVKSVKTDGGSFSVADGKVKFVWVSVPQKELLEISYMLVSNTTETIVLQGEYSYLEENQSKKLKLESESISFQVSEKIAGTEEEKKETLKNNSPSPEKSAQIVGEEQKAIQEKPEVPGQKNKPKKLNTVIEKVEGGLVYNVQIGAFSKRKANVKKLAEKFRITENIHSEMHAGYTKFMVGSHQEYKDARDHRNKIINENGVKSAFVVAYNKGKRITVQEALMITNQKWFK